MPRPKLLKLRKYKQSDDSLCGPASIRIVLSYYGIKASEEEIAKRSKHTYERGTNDTNMKKAVESYGLSCKIKNNSSFEDIKYYLAQEIPLIVDWFTGDATENGTPNGHSSVVAGINDNYIFLLDPWDGKIKKLPKEDFERVWFDWKRTKTIHVNHLIKKQIMVIKKKQEKI